ncbi:MAG TPA: DUF169 domain-containing protein [Melioribacteraceae bacterium]|nr:DUF169 domain-containing protein [Melioribacteraceae bacterium]
MDMNLKGTFLQKWANYFGDVELPIIFYYSDTANNCEIVPKAESWKCLIGELTKVRNGKSLAFSKESIGCMGGKKYSGFQDNLRPNFEYFLSCGNETVKGEKYLKSPELVKQFLAKAPFKRTDKQFIIFKRWDLMVEMDFPEIVIFYANPDVLSGLFTISGFDRDFEEGTITPFGAGCSSLIQYPLSESNKDKPRAVIGLFDVTARPYVQKDILTFAIPFKRFVELINFFDESFLTTEAWSKIKKRININKSNTL